MFFKNFLINRKKRDESSLSETNFKYLSFSLKIFDILLKQWENLLFHLHPEMKKRRKSEKENAKSDRLFPTRNSR